MATISRIQTGMVFISEHDADDLVSQAEAAEILGLSRVHVGRLAADGTLPARTVGEGRLARNIFNRSAVEQLREQRRADA